MAALPSQFKPTLTHASTIVGVFDILIKNLGGQVGLIESDLTYRQWEGNLFV